MSEAEVVYLLISKKDSPFKSEKEVKADIRTKLRGRGIYPINIWQGPLSENGISDLLCAVPPGGRILAVEVKKPGWKPPGEGTSKAYQHYLRQRNFLTKIIKKGGLGYFASDADMLMEALDAEDVPRLGQQPLFAAFG